MQRVVLLFLLLSCTKTPHLQLNSKVKEKANLDLSYSFEKFNKINIIESTEKKDSNRKMVCQYLEDYQEEVQNYRKMLDIIKKYQLTTKLINE